MAKIFKKIHYCIPVTKRVITLMSQVEPDTTKKMGKRLI